MAAAEQRTVAVELLQAFLPVAMKTWGSEGAGGAVHYNWGALAIATAAERPDESAAAACCRLFESDCSSHT